jgi:hypothetical protein
LIIALGAVTFKNIEWNSLLQWWIHIWWQDVLKSISKLRYFELKYDELYYLLSLYSKKSFFDYSLGGYSHRERWACTRRYSLVKHWSWRTAGVLLPSGASFMVEETRIFSVKIWLRHEILKLRYRNATRIPWLVTKVRPRDHGCTLLVCIRVYDAKKILVDTLGTLRTVGIMP